MSLSLVIADITTLSADALVNSTNQYLMGFSGIDRRVHEMGGAELEEECIPLRQSRFPGQSLHTNAYNMNYKYIVHTMCPRWHDGTKGEEAILRSCYWTALSEADSLGCGSVAMPLISAGTMGFPVPRALEIAITTITEYLAVYTDMYVQLVLHEGVLSRIAESMVGDLDQYISQIFKSPAQQGKKTLEQMIDSGGEDFATMLIRMIDEKGLNDVQVYKAAGVSKGTFNKIKNGGTKKPSIETISALAMAMRLSYDETVKLLASAGLAFSASSKFDIIVSYFIRNGIYDMWKLDEQLIKYDCKALLGIE